MSAGLAVPTDLEAGSKPLLKLEVLRAVKVKWLHLYNASNLFFNRKSKIVRNSKTHLS